MVLVFRRALLAAEVEERNDEPPILLLCRPDSRPCESDSEEPSKMSSSILLKDATWSSSSAFVGSIQQKNKRSAELACGLGVTR